MSIRSQTTQPDDLKLIYVSTVGSDLNSGNSISKPVRTIKRAVEIANAYITSPSRLVQINVASGVYSEILPIRVKYNVVIKGDTLRSTYIEPATGYEYEGFFKVDSNFKLWGCTLRGHQADATRQAWAISFDELADNQHRGAIGLGAFITTSPYIQNCTSYTAEDDAGLAGSASTGNTGGGMEVDGAKCAINSPIKSMVVDSYTQVNLSGPGILVKNDGYAQLVSCFGTFCTYHTKAESGGQVNMSGGSTSDFGDTGLVADGYSPTPLYTGAARLATYGATRLEKNVTIDTSTDTFTSTSHGLVAGDQVRFAVSQGTLPTNLVASTNYFVIAAGLTANTFRVSATSGGTTLDMTGTATGTYTFVRQGAVQIDVVDFTPNRLGRAIAYPSAGSLGSPGNPVTISARGGSTAGSSFTVTLGTAVNIKHQWIGGGTVAVGGTSYPITSATYNNATGATVLTATGYTPTIGASITLSGLTFICDSASRPNAGQLMFPQLVFPRNASTGAAQAKTFAYTRTGNFTLTYQEAASPNGPDHEYVSGGTAIIGSTDYGVAGATYNKTTGVVTLTTKTQLPAGNGNITVEGLVFICPSSAYIVTASTPIDSSGTPVAKDSPTRAGYRVEFFSGVNGGLKDPVTQGQRLDFRNRSQIAAGAHTFEFVGSGTNYDALPWNGGVANPANAVLESNNGRVYYSATTERGDFSVGSQFKVDGTTGEVTISTSQFNLSGLNFIGPFSRNGGLSTVGEQLREVSNNPALIASTGAADGNTVPTQSAIVGYLTNRTVTGGAGLAGGGNLVANQVISANLKVNGGLVFDNGAIAVDLSASNIAGTLGFIDGGTGATTQQGAINALAGATTAGRFLRGDGTNVTLAAIQASDVPILNQNTTGTASNVTGVVAPANGGTGLTALGAGIATFLATPTSANLAATVTDETGTGALVFTNSPTITSPAFTGTVTGITKTMVGLGNVDNTTDLSKPISTATQSALDLKANTSGTNATGTWSISITGNAATVTNGVVTTGTYADPAWITSLSASKLSGPILLLERTAQTAAYTLALADAGQVVVMSAASAVTLTVPDNATVAFAIGTVINIYNTSASTLTISGASGVTVQNNSAGLSQYQEISIRKRAANEWVRVG